MNKNKLMSIIAIAAIAPSFASAEYLTSEKSKEVVKTALSHECVKTVGDSKNDTKHAVECGDKQIVVAVPKEAPKTPVVIRNTLSNETLFKFDSADLSENGEAVLSSFVQPIDSNTIQNIKVSGFTDELGSKEYNLDLSYKRAVNVAGFLASKTNFSISDMNVSGFGEAYAQMGERCKSELNMKSVRPTKKMISCLAPDRKVEIEIEVQYQEAK